ncbi:MAG: hypothetical protein LBE36_10075 [Flavobacteriaceae bacterium]|jgi:hypothetical protein|nr:hypothetical protein [Flavobacteriaceae bacterium]
METIIENPPLNEAQLFILQTLALTKGKQEKEELTSLYLDYIQRKMDIEMDRWWKENDMTVEKFEEMCSNLHYRTPYK